MASQTPDQIAANWAQRLGASTQKITDGVNAVTVAPGQAAARQKELWAQQVAASKDKWAANTSAVSLQTWQSDTIQKGVPRIASGATAAQPKFQAFMTQLLPAIDSARGALPARGGLDANINRMTQFVRAMAKFQYKK